MTIDQVNDQTYEMLHDTIEYYMHYYYYYYYYYYALAGHEVYRILCRTYVAKRADETAYVLGKPRVKKRRKRAKREPTKLPQTTMANAFYSFYRTRDNIPQYNTL